jgi:hypothetical protein
MASCCKQSDGNGAHADRQIAHRKLDLLIKTGDIAFGGDAFAQCSIESFAMGARLRVVNSGTLESVDVGELVE